MKGKFLSLICLYSLLIILNASCTSSNDKEQNDIPEGQGTFSIENEYIIYDDPGRISESTSIRIKGIINVEPTQESLKALHNSNRFARIGVNSINGKKFEIKAQGNIQLDQDSTVRFEINLYKTTLQRSQLKELPESMDIDGFYVYYGDTTEHPLHITAEINAKETNIYTRLINGDLEEEIGIKIDPSIIKGLVLNQFECLRSKTKIDLSKFTSVETLYIRGYMIGQPFPEEVYKLKHIKDLTFDVTNVNIDGTWRNISECKLYLPRRVLEMNKLTSLAFKHTIALNIPDFPDNCPLERFEVFSSTKVDSIPSTITRLEKLKNLSFLLGSIQEPLPDNLNKLTSLDTLIIKLPDAQIPKNFGPWENLNYVKILQTNNSGIDRELFDEKKRANIAELTKTFSNVKHVFIDGKQYY